MPFVGYAVYLLISGKRKAKNSGAAQTAGTKSAGRELAGAVIGGFAGINAAALAAAIEFGIQPMLFCDAAGNAKYCPYPLQVAIPAMMIGHLTIFGLAEAVYTAAIYLFLQKTAPAALCGDEILMGGSGSKEEASEAGREEKAKKSWGIPVLLGALMIGTPLGLLAEGTAWGEWGADEIAATGAGYTPSGMLNGFSFEVLLPDYSLGNAPAVVGYLLSAAIGVAVLMMAFRLIAGFAGKKSKHS